MGAWPAASVAGHAVNPLGTRRLHGAGQ